MDATENLTDVPVEGPTEVPEADLVERLSEVEPIAAHSFDDLEELPAEASEADVLEQRMDVRFDEDDYQ